jgi:hypothetical protein
VTVAVPVTPWSLTVIVAVPELTPVTSPPGEVTVATVVSEDDHPTSDPEIVFWLPSEYFPVAVSWVELLTATVAAAGFTKIEPSVGLIKKPEQLPNDMQTKRANPAVRTERGFDTGQGDDNLVSTVSLQDDLQEAASVASAERGEVATLAVVAVTPSIELISLRSTRISFSDQTCNNAKGAD